MYGQGLPLPCGYVLKPCEERTSSSLICLISASNYFLLSITLKEDPLCQVLKGPIGNWGKSNAREKESDAFTLA
jgi:hypothetical protein